MPYDDDRNAFRVAVVVLAEVRGVTLGDAVNVTELALKQAMGAPLIDGTERHGWLLQPTKPPFYVKEAEMPTVHVKGIQELNEALHRGALSIDPTPLFWKDF